MPHGQISQTQTHAHTSNPHLELFVEGSASLSPEKGACRVGFAVVTSHETFLTSAHMLPSPHFSLLPLPKSKFFDDDCKQVLRMEIELNHTVNLVYQKTLFICSCELINLIYIV